MPPAAGSLLFQAPPHTVDIYLPSGWTFDTGGGVKLGWPAKASQLAVPCIINTSGSSTVERQGQGTITVGNRVSIWSELLTVTLVQGTKLVAPDSGRTFIVRGLTSPNRPFGDYATDMPALTYLDCDEIL